MDAVHPVHNTEAGYGWFRKGEKRRLFTIHTIQHLMSLRRLAVIFSRYNILIAMKFFLLWEMAC